MTIDALLIGELVVLGTATGFVAGLLGIGGGGIMVPFIAAILSARGIAGGLSVKLAIATAMAVIIFTSISNVYAHQRQGSIRWDIVTSLAPGLVVGSLLASLGAFAILKGSVLALLFAIFLLVAATRMFRSRKPAPGRHLPGPMGLFGAGGLIGFLSGLVGIGGGSVSVPFMTWCNVSIRNAVGTSAALGFPIAITNVAGYIWAGRGVTGLPAHSVGYIWLPGLLAMAVCTMLMAPVGARVAHAVPVSVLRRIFAVMLYALSLYMFYKAFNAGGT